MSFYGNTYLEYKKFFYEYYMKASPNNYGFLTDPDLKIGNSAIKIIPQSNFDSFEIQAGNYWIEMGKNTSPYLDSDNNKIYTGITLYHAPPGPEKATNVLNGFNKNGEAGTLLKPGDYFSTTKSFSFDAAGHLTNNSGIETYQLPKVEIKEGGTEEGKADISGFRFVEKYDNQTQAGYQKLGVGDYFTADSFIYDPKENSLKITTNKYQLPIPASDLTIGHLKTRVAGLETLEEVTIKTEEETYSNSAFIQKIKSIGDVGKLYDLKAGVKDEAKIKDLVGAIGELSGLCNVSAVDKTLRITNVVQAIGNLDELYSKNFEGTKSESLVDALGQIDIFAKDLTDFCTFSLGSINGWNNGLSVDTSTLSAGLSTFIKKVYSEISKLTRDIDSLDSDIVDFDQYVFGIDPLDKDAKIKISNQILSNGGFYNWITGINGKIGDVPEGTNLKTWVEGLDKKIGDVSVEKTDLATWVSKLESSFTDLKDNVIGTPVGEVSIVGQITGINSRIDQLSSKIGEVPEGTNLKTLINGLDGKIGEVPEGINLKTWVDGLDNKIGKNLLIPEGKTNLITWVDGLDKKIGEVPEGTNLVSWINSKIGNVPADTNLAAQIGGLKDKIGNVPADTNLVSWINGKIGTNSLSPLPTTGETDLVSWIKSLDTRVKALEPAV